MKTIWAVVAHAGILMLQGIAAAQFFDTRTPTGLLKHLSVQAAVQSVLWGLSTAVVVRNSNTDPQGRNLVETSPDHYQTEHK